MNFFFLPHGMLNIASNETMPNILFFFFFTYLHKAFICIQSGEVYKSAFCLFAKATLTLCANVAESKERPKASLRGMVHSNGTIVWIQNKPPYLADEGKVSNVSTCTWVYIFTTAIPWNKVTLTKPCMVIISMHHFPPITYSTSCSLQVVIYIAQTGML